VESLYGWRPLARLGGVAAALAVLLVVAPLAVMAVGLAVFPIDFLLKMVGLGAGGLVASYLALAETLFAPSALPTWLPRLVLLVLGAAVVAVAVDAWTTRGERRQTGRFWWRMLGPPLTREAVVDRCWASLWDLVRGAARVKQPPPLELGGRSVELLLENLGQPGFRELLIVAHDVDAHADVVFALVGEAYRRELVRRPTTAESEARRSGVVDLSGVGREHLADAVAGALAVPLATAYHLITFAPESYWRGETHRLCDRPGSLLRLLAELGHVGVEQIILVSAAPLDRGPHHLEPPRIDGRARIGEYLQSTEAAVVADAVGQDGEHRPRMFTIRPAHNPIGPFDFGGGFDDRSDRRQPLRELLSRGYEDAYRQFIEPVVGASGERVGAR